MVRLICAAYLAVFFCNAFAQTIAGEVVSVADGDTITILENTGRRQGTEKNTHHRHRCAREGASVRCGLQRGHGRTCIQAESGG